MTFLSYLLDDDLPLFQMRSRLDRITDWKNLAEDADYSPGEIARRCGVSPRQLERFTLESKGKTPTEWLNDFRQRRAVVLMKEGYTVIEPREPTKAPSVPRK